MRHRNQNSARRILVQATLLALLPVAANADTLATFDWVAVSNGGSGIGSGDLIIDLPGTITGPTFNVAFGSMAAAKSAVTDFKYTFSNGDSLGLADLKAGTLQMNPVHWQTTNTITPSGAPTGVYLGTTFQLSGFATPPGGVLSPWSVASSGGMVTLGAGDAQLRITDTGYWKLDSLTPVPLPAGLWLLVSGAAGFLRLTRRKATAA